MIDLHWPIASGAVYLLLTNELADRAVAIFQVSPDKLKEVPETSFGAEAILERNDLQRLLRDQIDVLDAGCKVVAEEFGDWLDSSRRIDLLCIDKDANLVVVELKRSDDGGHMELQALRYAAMISTMTFEHLVATYAKYQNQAEPNIEQAKADLVRFLEWDDVDETKFAQDTRIVLACADFGKELTTAVLWLREYGIDIRCIRLKPYKMQDGTVLLDVDQFIPLPEAAEITTTLSAKKIVERQQQTARQELRSRFWAKLLDYSKTKTDLFAHRKPTKDSGLTTGIGRTGFWLCYSLRETESRVELWISRGPGQALKNKAAFGVLEAQKPQIEADFGAPLEWQELPEADACRIRYVLNGGYKSPSDQWSTIDATLVDAMIRLDKALRARVGNLAY